MNKIILIAAVTKCKNSKLGIGFKNKVPWNLPEDLKFFKDTTLNKVVVMGRKTYESIGKPLKNRLNIVLTKDIHYKSNDKDVLVNNSLSDLINFLKKMDSEYKEIYIIGGQEIYTQFLGITGLVHSIIITEVSKNSKTDVIECDTYFPEIPWNFVISDYTLDVVSKNNDYKFKIIKYINKKLETDINEIYNVNYTINQKYISNESLYINLVKDIMKNGNIREDRSGVGTISKFGCQLKFDISQTIPLLTTKRVPWKMAIEEMLWMLRGSIDSLELQKKGIKIWNGHTSREFLDKSGFSHYKQGEIPYGYGHQIRNAGGDTFNCKKCDTENEISGFDQLQFIMNELKSNPFSRRIKWNLWTSHQMIKTPLPCCFPAKTLILTENGYKNIENVNLDDKLYTHKGNWKNIVNIQTKYYNDTMYEFKLQYNSKKIKATREHPFFVKNIDASQLENDPYWCKAENLDKEKHVMCLPINKKNVIHQFNSDISIINENEWFLLGFFIDNGFIDLNQSKFYLIINKKQTFVYDKISKVLHLTLVSESDTIYECYNETWLEILKDFDNLPHNKKIPEWIQDSPKEMIQWFINGHTLSDTCEIGYFTSSENFAYGLQRLYAKLKIMTSVNCHVLINKETNDTQNTFTITKIQNQINDDYITFPISDIKTITQENPIQVYNFEVIDDNSYTVQNVSVHNCHADLQFYVEENNDIKYLSAMVGMRSNDIACGNPFNIFGYSVLVYIIAMKCNMVPKELIFNLGDAHIYNTHLNKITEQISKTIKSQPILHLNENIKNKDFNDITIDDFEIVGYYPHPTIKYEMAI